MLSSPGMTEINTNLEAAESGCGRVAIRLDWITDTAPRIDRSPVDQDRLSIQISPGSEQIMATEVNSKGDQLAPRHAALGTSAAR